MKTFRNLLIVLVLAVSINLNAQNEKGQSEIALITSTLMDYIEGTGNGEPERLKRAFHPDFNLYTIAGDTLRVRSGEKYIANVEQGKKPTVLEELFQ